MRRIPWSGYTTLLVLVVLWISSSMTYENQTIKPGIEQYIPLDWVRHLEWIRFTYETEVSVDALGRAGFIEFLIRKLAHLSTFFVLGFSLIDLTRRAVPSLGIASIFAYSLAITFAVFDEFHQILTGGRTGMIEDALLDGLGALAGILAYSLFFRRRRTDKLKIRV